jgi:hypothetical protein
MNKIQDILFDENGLFEIKGLSKTKLFMKSAVFNIYRLARHLLHACKNTI